jgi:FixJ family two-component response regulator
VEVHRAKVMEKLSCRTLSDVIRLAMQAGLLRA